MEIFESIALLSIIFFAIICTASTSWVRGAFYLFPVISGRSAAGVRGLRVRLIDTRRTSTVRDVVTLCRGKVAWAPTVAGGGSVEKSCAVWESSGAWLDARACQTVSTLHVPSKHESSYARIGKLQFNYVLISSNFVLSHRC